PASPPPHVSPLSLHDALPIFATQAGPVTLYPALSVVPDATTAEFDARYPEGADYVIVPAMEPNDDPAALQWLNAQASKGATVIGDRKSTRLNSSHVKISYAVF